MIIVEEIPTLSPMSTFIPLNELLLPPPFSTLSGILLMLGLWSAGYWVAGRLWRRTPDGVNTAFGFIVATAAVTATAQMIGLVGWRMRPLLTILAGCLIFAGITGIVRHTRTVLRLAKNVLWTMGWRRMDRESRFGLITLLFLMSGLSLTVLAPPIGSDSVIIYHIAEPLRWLGAGRIWGDPLAVHNCARAQGEILYMLGLVAGTDIFGALMQLSGLFILLLAVNSLAKSAFHSLLGSLLVTGVPLVLVHVPNQNPYMLPVSALVLALIGLVRYAPFSRLAERSTSSIEVRSFRVTLGAAIIAALFAAGQKHLFILSGIVVGTVILFMASKARRLRYALSVLFGAFMLLLLPFYLSNFFFYGDPLGFLLKAHMPGVDTVIRMHWQGLKYWESGYLAGRPLLRYLVGYAIPLEPRFYSDILGVGQYAFVFALIPLLKAWRQRRPQHTLSRDRTVQEMGIAQAQTTPSGGMKRAGNKCELSEKQKSQLYWMLATVTGGILMAILLGNMLARSFLDVYCIGAATVMIIPWSRGLLWLRRLATMQALIPAIAALTSAVLIFPGALTPALRHQVMMDYTYGYAMTRWLDSVLPPDAVILVGGWLNHAHQQRPFVYAGYMETQPELIFSRSRPTHLVFEGGLKRSDTNDFSFCMRPNSLRTAVLPQKLLNPFLEANHTHYSVIALDRSHPDCPLGIASE